MSQTGFMSRFGHDAHAHLLDCGLCLFDLGFQFLHDIAQPGGPGGGLCEYNQCLLALYDP